MSYLVRRGYTSQRETIFPWGTNEYPDSRCATLARVMRVVPPIALHSSPPPPWHLPKRRARPPQAPSPNTELPHTHTHTHTYTHPTQFLLETTDTKIAHFGGCSLYSPQDDDYSRWSPLPGYISCILGWCAPTVSSGHGDAILSQHDIATVYDVSLPTLSQV